MKRRELRYPFEVDLDPTRGGVEIGVEADGYATWSDSRHVTSLTGEPVDLGLARIGGVIEITPIYATIVTAGQLDVAIGNAPDASSSLVILRVSAHEHYGSGSGRGFTVDSDAIALPAVLEPGEHVVLPVSYDGAGEHLPASLLIYGRQRRDRGRQLRLGARLADRTAGRVADAAGAADRTAVAHQRRARYRQRQRR